MICVLIACIMSVNAENITISGNDLFDGTFNQVREYNDCSDIGLDYPYMSTQIEYSFRCNNSNDNSDCLHDGVVVGAVWNSTDGHNTHDLGSFVFNGVDDYIISPYSLHGENKGSIEVWFKTDVSQTKFIVSMPDDPPLGAGMDIYVDNAGSNKIAGGLDTSLTGRKTLSYTVDYTTNEWFHVVLTYNGSNIYLYVNGNLEDSDTATGTIDAFIEKLNVGRFGSSGYYFDGVVNIVRVYNDSFSQLEILSLYNTGLPFYNKGNASYFIDLNGALSNITLNKTRDGTINIYLEGLLRCSLTEDNEFCGLNGYYTDGVGIVIELVNGSSPNYNLITLGIITDSCISNTGLMSIYIGLIFLFIVIGYMINNIFTYILFGFGLFMLSFHIINICDISFLWIICLFFAIFFFIQIFIKEGEDG